LHVGEVSSGLLGCLFKKNTELSWHSSFAKNNYELIEKLACEEHVSFRFAERSLFALY
jgi:hypothetical protein